MHITRRAELVVQTAAIAWAAILVLGGLWLLAFGPAVLPVPGASVFCAAVGLLGAAQFLFMVLVADHLFPHVYAGLRVAGEVGSFVIFVAGLSLAAWFLVRS